MKRVLLTGMSGTGKSSVIGELAALGYKAIDTDDGWCEPLPDGRQRWREDAIAALLDAADADVVFIAGCEENQVRFHSRFDLIILLSAPAQTMAGRLAARTGNPSAKHAATWTGSSVTWPRSSRCCGRWPTMRSVPPSRSPTSWPRYCTDRERGSARVCVTGFGRPFAPGCQAFARA